MGSKDLYDLEKSGMRKSMRSASTGDELAQLTTIWPTLPVNIRAAVRLLAGLGAPGPGGPE